MIFRVEEASQIVQVLRVYHSARASLRFDDLE
ncbi:hypothetical protein EON80_11370 [bacterium]|nr:MAG: hypothetical protein EON80_11370 [bacterium]